MNDVNLYEEIFTAAHDLYNRSGRIEGLDLNNWLKAEKIVSEELFDRNVTL